MLFYIKYACFFWIFLVKNLTHVKYYDSTYLLTATSDFRQSALFWLSWKPTGQVSTLPVKSDIWLRKNFWPYFLLPFFVYYFNRLFPLLCMKLSTKHIKCYTNIRSNILYLFFANLDDYFWRKKEKNNLRKKSQVQLPKY